MVINLVGLEISVPVVIWTIINFLLLLLILSKFLFKPILRTMDERKAAIDADLAKAEKAKKELADTHEQLRKEISDTNDQARDIIYAAKISDEKERGSVLEEAGIQVKEIRKNAGEQSEGRKEIQEREVDENMTDMVELLKEKLLS